VSVKPSPSGVSAPPRPADCHVEFLRREPARSFDELAELYGYYSTVVEPERVLRQKACELGADAVIVTLDFLKATDRAEHKIVSGIAIKYRDGPERADRRGGAAPDQRKRPPPWS
jgi:hypothetical protein